MSAINGYSIYVVPNAGALWTVRAYRDSDDTHVHSAESARLDVGLSEAAGAISKDLNSQSRAGLAEQR